MSSNCPDDDDDIQVPFAVWPVGGSETDARSYRATTAKLAAEQRARADYSSVEESAWPITYCARDGLNGQIWTVLVGVVMQPTFVALEANEASS
jgi:hypothetical protein